jgi:uncharacterized membrane protein
MGYFDALTSGYFKTAPDGRKLFFPWGVLGRGYAIDSEQDYERLRRQVKAYTIVSLVLIVGVTALQAYVGAVVIGALLIAFYLGWMRYLLRGLQASDERLSLQDSMTSQARAHSATGLWLLQIGALAFVALGIFILVDDPDNWLVALGSIVFFGLCAGFAARLLVLRRRAATGRR